MSSTEDDDYTIKLDANIEVETVVRNRFEEYEDLCCNDPFSNQYSVSSDEEQAETSVESSQASVEYRDLDNVTSVGSDLSETCTSAVSDVSAESTDSMAVDIALNEVIKEQAATSKGDIHFLESRVKYVNCKELIVFCIDMSSDMEKVPYIVTDEAKHSPLSMIKRAIGMFVHNKHFIDKKHEYSLMVLYDTATWVCEFTNNPHQLMDALEDLTETVECNSCDVSSIVTLLTEKYPFILSTEFLPADVHRILRVILIYSRTNCNIKFSDPNAKDILMDNPSLFLDIVYIHEPPSEQNKCVEIFESLCNLDDRDKSYIFETTRSVTSLHNAMGRLLSHPFQRVPQKNTNYRLQDIVPSEQQRNC